MIRKVARISTNARLNLHVHILARTLREGMFGVGEFQLKPLLNFLLFTIHSFLCKCPEGFILDNDDRTCMDVDECTTGNHDCSDICTNNEGSYQCSCPSGMLLSPDGRDCANPDPCATDNGGCSQLCEVRSNLSVCSCRNGFEIDMNDISQCIDINECDRENK